MYGKAFCEVYNQFGWNYYPEAFGAQLLRLLEAEKLQVHTAVDLGCGTGVLCEVLHANGIRAIGVDLSGDMIALAKQRCPEITYAADNMITFHPEAPVQLVTCTGDAVNHLADLKDVAAMFRNVLSYLEPGGLFVFDILNEAEAEPGEPIEFDYSETVKGSFHITREKGGRVQLKVTVFEDGKQTVEEIISEVLHDPADICRLLSAAGFTDIACRHSLLPDDPVQALTWFITARKPMPRSCEGILEARRKSLL